MSCYNPRLMIRKKVLSRADDGSIRCDYEYEFARSHPGYDDDGAIASWTPDGDVIKVPCGKCIGCLLDRSRMWADRCMLEMQYHESNLFVTLTYDDVHVPVSYYPDPDTGEALPSLTLCRRDVQLFLKRLRKRTGQKIRYFGSGEYGTNTYRPHYHLIMFGLSLDDLIPAGRSGTGFQYFTSSLLSDTWGNGFVSVAPATWETAAYTARYVTKKAGRVDPCFYETFNLVPEFSMMSTHPGIGRQFYDDHRDEIYSKGCINISTPKGGKKIYPCAYFDRLFALDDPDSFDIIKEQRIDYARTRERAKLSRTDLNEDQLNDVLQDYKTASAKKLLRNTI